MGNTSPSMNIYLKAFVLIKRVEKYKYVNYIKPHINSESQTHTKFK